MPRYVTGREYPERARMSTISDLLGIPHFTTSNGGTVRKDFLGAVAVALGVPASSIGGLNKDEVLGVIWETIWGEQMPASLFSNGATVTNDALQGIIDGVIENNLSPVLDGDVPDESGQGIDEEEIGAEGGFVDLEDGRRRRVGEQAVRDGQSGFRSAVLEAYGFRCAVTGFDSPVVLQAAHIAPYMGVLSNDVRNGLCLRSDVHALFDRHMLTIHEVDLRIMLTPPLRVTRYADLDGVEIAVPARRQYRPDTAALRRHREQTGLAAD